MNRFYPPSSHQYTTMLVVGLELPIDETKLDLAFDRHVFGGFAVLNLVPLALRIATYLCANYL
jgi:hypothetical protein